MSVAAEGVPTCAKTPTLQRDVAWLLHRGAHRMRAEWDQVAQLHGLRDLRDWIVLTAIDEGQNRTQLAIGMELGLDKTTLTSLLDRLERDGFVVRNMDPNDRRARIPALTAEGERVQAKLIEAREKIDAVALAGYSDAERELLFGMLGRLAGVDEAGEPLHGSCMR